MGNYNCCTQKKPSKILCKIRTAHATPGTLKTLSNSPKVHLEQQFQKNYHIAIENLAQQDSQKISDPNCFNVNILQKLGKGAQSQVYLVQTDYQMNQMSMALKVISKQFLRTESLQKSVAMQGILLQHNNCPFLMNSYLSRQDEKNVYFFCPVAKGGDLISFTQQLSGKGQVFEKDIENNIRFIAAGVILGLQYLHDIGIIFNDLKLQNILINDQGYPMLSDFGLVEPQLFPYFQEVVGTITYLSPQKIYHKNYGKAVDFWALGVLLYSLYFRQMPFDKDVITSPRFIAEIKKKQGRHKQMSSRGSKEFKDLVNSLLKEKPEERVGVISIQKIKNHSFFEGFDWDLYAKKQLKSPLKKIVDQFPLQYLKEEISIERFKVFRRNDSCQKYLYNLGRKTVSPVQKDMFSTRDCLSQPRSQISLAETNSFTTQSVSSTQEHSFQ